MHAPQAVTMHAALRLACAIAMSAGFVIGVTGAAESATPTPPPSVPAPTAPVAVQVQPGSGAALPAAATEPPSVEVEVARMLEAMTQTERDAGQMLDRLDSFLAEGKVRYGGSGAVPQPDWRGPLFERVGARIHALIDPKLLADQREAARAMLAGGDAVGARKLILDYMQPFMLRGEEAGTLMNYLPRRVVADLGMARLLALLRANQVSSPDLPRIEQLLALVANRESREDFLMAADLELGELEALQQKAYEAAFVEALKAATARPPESRVLQERAARCPVVSDLGPVTPAPKVNTILSTPTANYFPPEALAQGVEGKVAVYARVTPEGCVRAAGVLVSTGVDALDAAALRWMLEGAVFSRSTPLKGGELATTMLNVSFKSVD